MLQKRASVLLSGEKKWQVVRCVSVNNAVMKFQCKAEPSMLRKKQPVGGGDLREMI